MKSPSSIAIAYTAAAILLLVGAPRYSDAQNLRRLSSSNDASADADMTVGFSIDEGEGPEEAFSPSSDFADDMEGDGLEKEIDFEEGDVEEELDYEEDYGFPTDTEEYNFGEGYMQDEEEEFVYDEDYSFDVDYDFNDEEEGDGFEIVGEPLIFEEESYDNDGYDIWYNQSVSEGRSLELEDGSSFFSIVDEEEGEDAEMKEYVNDESLDFVSGPSYLFENIYICTLWSLTSYSFFSIHQADPEEHDEHNRQEQSCASNEKQFFFKITTDNYGYEESWTLEQKIARTADSWQTLASGPPVNTKYQDRQTYTGAKCLPAGRMYKLTIYDQFQDGFCCNFGKGTYSYSIGGVEKYNSNGQRTFTDKAEHKFMVTSNMPSGTVPAPAPRPNTRRPTSRPTPKILPIGNVNNNQCKRLNQACSANGHCCSKRCGQGGKCLAAQSSTANNNQCRRLNQACSANGHCCSKRCGQGGKCLAAQSAVNNNNNQCRRLNQVCSNNGHCCSKRCGQNRKCLAAQSNNNNANTSSNSNRPGFSSNQALIFSGRAGSVCGTGKQQMVIKIKCDKYGQETSWELRNLANNQIVRQKKKGSYSAFSTDNVVACVPHGKYRFTVRDAMGDGMCCGEGRGWYDITLDGRKVIRGSDFSWGSNKQHEIIVGYHTKYGQMNQRDRAYLECHNWRRKKYHERFGSTYTPQVWDFSLAQHAKSWATRLLNDCNKDGIKHEPGVSQGENLAKNRGTGKWGKQYNVENICSRWFEREETWPYPDNAHLTQGLWKSSLYVGCGEATKTMANGGRCHVQVCRYARAGNCNMGKYKATIGQNWKQPMLMDDNPCGPVCPPGGCH